MTSLTTLVARSRSRLSSVLFWFKLADAAGRHLPFWSDEMIARIGGALWYVGSTSKRRSVVRDHQRMATRGRFFGWRLELQVLAAYISYVRYYLDLFTTAHRDSGELRTRTTVENLEGFLELYRQGRGVIIVSGHIGNWDYGAYWFAASGRPITAVVEKLEPLELAEWFLEKRESLGVEAVFLGPSAAGEITKRLANGMVAALVADRDIAGAGEPMPFFDRMVRFPLGPALIAERSGAPVMGCAIYTGRRGERHIVFEGPVPPAPAELGGLRARVTWRTREIARLIEHLIDRAPEQWHVFVPLEELAQQDSTT